MTAVRISAERSSTTLLQLGRHASRFLVFYVALACFTVTVLAYYPGYMSPDSVMMLDGARHGVTSNVYSPLLSYIWRMTDKVIPGPGGMLIFQNLVYWLSLGLIACSATTNRLLRCAFVVCSGLWPPTFGMLGTIWKDVGMQGFLLAAVAFILYANYKQRLWPLVIATLVLFMACGYRQNAIAAAIPLIATILYYFSLLGPKRFIRPYVWAQEKRLMPAFYSLMAIFLLASFLIGLNLLNNYGVQDAKLWSDAMVHDLAGISVLQNTNYLPPYVNRNGLSVEDLKHMYSPLHANSLFIPESRRFLGVPDPLPDKTVSYSLTNADARALQFHWLRVVLEHPGSYLHHRLSIMKRLLVLRPRQPWYPYITGIDPNPFGLTFHADRFNQMVMAMIRYSAFSTSLYSAWVYYAAVFLCAAVSFLWDFAYARFVQLLAVSVGLYFLSIFGFGMSGDFRYNIWALSCCPLCVFLLLCGPASSPVQATAVPALSVRDAPSRRS